MERGLDGTGIRSCPMATFAISDVESVLLPVLPWSLNFRKWSNDGK
jgi:hypothetical protein